MEPGSKCVCKEHLKEVYMPVHAHTRVCMCVDVHVHLCSGVCVLACVCVLRPERKGWHEGAGAGAGRGGACLFLSLPSLSKEGWGTVVTEDDKGRKFLFRDFCYRAMAADTPCSLHSPLPLPGSLLFPPVHTSESPFSLSLKGTRGSENQSHKGQSLCYSSSYS